jgi:hypothetical protein
MTDDRRVHLTVITGDGQPSASDRDRIRSARLRQKTRQTESLREMAPIVRSRFVPMIGDYTHPGEMTRGDCEGGHRPCPLVSCKWHLYLDTSPITGSVTLNFPDLEPEQMPANASCALDIADLGGSTREAVADYTNVTREAIRQYEIRPRKVLRHGLKDYAPEGDVDKVSATGDGAPSLFRPSRTTATPMDADDGSDSHEVRTRSSDFIGLDRSDESSAARFGSIAGAYVLSGVPVAVAWDRANEWLEESPGSMPEGIELVQPAPPPREIVPFATPVARLKAAPPEKEDVAMTMTMTDRVKKMRETIVSRLRELGPTAPRDLGIDATPGQLASAMRSLVAEGTCEKLGRATGARWQLTGEKRTGKPPSKPADAPATALRPRPAPAASPPRGAIVHAPPTPAAVVPHGGEYSWTDDLIRARDKLLRKAAKIDALLAELDET